MKEMSNLKDKMAALKATKSGTGTTTGTGGRTEVKYLGFAMYYLHPLYNGEDRKSATENKAILKAMLEAGKNAMRSTLRLCVVSRAVTARVTPSGKSIGPSPGTIS